MAGKDKQAAHMLEGKILNNGWKVVKKLFNEGDDRGGVYSCCYEVQNGERQGFLKAFDYSAATKIGENDPEAQIQNLLMAYRTEKEILEKCKEHKLKNVIQLIEHGSCDVSEAEFYPRVVYLILEYAANGDVMNYLKQENLTLKWKLESLHQLIKGLRQIHNLSIAHQDLKPTNIVATEQQITKLSDFGSAVHLNLNNEQLPRHLRKDYAGTWAYAPPDLVCGNTENDVIIRRIGCDLYLLGSMIVFYFTNMTMNALILQNLSEELAWGSPQNYGRFNEIEPYLQMAFERAISDLKDNIQIQALKEPIAFVVKCLCQPNPKLRGHPRTIAFRGQNFDLERFLTIFSRLLFDLKSGKIK